MTYISASAVARHLGCRQSAITNWVRRSVLPSHLQPLTFVEHDIPGREPIPLFSRTQLYAFTVWFTEPKKTGRRYGK